MFYQPLVWVGNVPPSEQENQILANDLQNVRAHGMATEVAALQEFVTTHPNSPWNPSLQANLGRYYFEHGRYTEAIQNWGSAWAATKAASDGPAKQIADFTFTYWTKLLVGVGQVNALRSLLEEAQGRTFEALSFRIMVNNTRQEYRLMIGGTDASFRCGTFALNDMLRAMKQPTIDIAKVMATPAPVTGFSLNKLVKLGGQAGAKLVAAQWGPDRMPVVPSVVHWKQDHYAAIVTGRNGLYQVNDSALGRPVWLSLADIQAEADGYFVVPKDKLPNDWKPLTAAQADEIYGRGYVKAAPDSSDGCGNGSGGSQ